MQPLTYLAFTLLSILIQFSFMDLIQDKYQIEGRKDSGTYNLRSNSSSQVKKLSDVLKEYYSNKPHALYYRNHDRKPLIVEQKLVLPSKIIANSTTAEERMSTIQTETEDVQSSTFTILLDEENETAISTTEMPTTTEFENVSEFSIFGSRNTTPAAAALPTPTYLPKIVPKDEHCKCNLLYKVCDSNCCCDIDCSVQQVEVFNCTGPETKSGENDVLFCPNQDTNPLLIDSVNGLFCIANSNIPKRRIANAEMYAPSHVQMTLDQSLKWSSKIKDTDHIIFTKTRYVYGDPIWLLHKGAISYVDLPSPKINNYCKDRKAIKFLKEESWQCDVNIQDLEMLLILKNIEDTSIVSVTQASSNSTALNCSTLHCTNWTLLVCNLTSCVGYDKLQHEPTCTDNFVCTGLAHKIEYIFHYNDGKIVNATIHMHISNLYSSKIPLIAQHVGVKFYVALTNETENVVKLSGTPGYMRGFPLVSSYEKGNYTKNFFSNRTIPRDLKLPDNVNGLCVRTNLTGKVLLFGENLRRKCRFVFTKKLTTNATAACESLNAQVKQTLNIRSTKISSLGDPNGLEDSDWINLELIEDSNMANYEENKFENSSLFCNRVIKRMSLIIGYANVGTSPDADKIKILAARVVVSHQSKTFALDDISVVLTYEAVFVDVTKKPIYEYAGSPHLNIYLPRDFFFPFTGNRNNVLRFNYFSLIITLILSLFA